MRRGAVALAAVLAALMTAVPAQATVRHASAFALNYLTPIVRMAPGDTVIFKNLDPFAQHNIQSNKGLFSTPLISQGYSAQVAGASTLRPGNYLFHCVLHTWMRGALVVR
jgi:plastocyanin